MNGDTMGIVIPSKSKSDNDIPEEYLLSMLEQVVMYEYPGLCEDETGFIDQLAEKGINMYFSGLQHDTITCKGKNGKTLVFHLVKKNNRLEIEEIEERD